MPKISLSVALLVLSLAGCDHRPTNTCLSGRSDALRAGKFSGPIVCSAEDATFIEIGRIGDYVLFDYRYRFLPEHGAVMHGGQRIVMFKGARYLGQYALNPPPHATVSVKGSKVLFQREDATGVSVMDFSNGPPLRIFAGGDFSDLSR